MLSVRPLATRAMSAARSVTSVLLFLPLITMSTMLAFLVLRHEALIAAIRPSFGHFIVVRVQLLLRLISRFLGDVSLVEEQKADELLLGQVVFLEQFLDQGRL